MRQNQVWPGWVFWLLGIGEVKRDGTAKSVCDTEFSGVKEKDFFSCIADHDQDSQSYPVDAQCAKVKTNHTYG